MDYENLSDEEIQQRLDEAILKADPKTLTDEELDRRLEIRGHKSPDMIRGSLDAAGDVLGMAGTVWDYPQGIARAAADGVRGMMMKDKSPAKALEDVGEAFEGPSHAPTWAQIMEKIGVPDSAAEPAGFGMDLLTGAAEAQALNSGAKVLAKGARKALDADEMALKAVGTRPKVVEQMIQKSPVDDPLKEARNFSKYAQNEVISPMSSTEKLLMKAGKKLDDVGTELGDIRKRNEKAVEKWIASGPKNPEVVEYLESSFNPRKAIQRVFDQIDTDIADPDYAQQVKDLVAKKLESLVMKFQNKDVPMDQLSKLKSGWQREINFGKEMPDFSVREDAFNYLQREANRAIDNEIKFGDRFLKGSDLVRHTKLKEEYGILTKMNAGIKKKLSSEVASKGNLKLNPFTWEMNPGASTRGQSTIASIPENPNPFGVKTQALGAAGQLMNMREGEYKEPTIGGFPSSKTLILLPVDAQKAEQEIQRSEMSNTEKARRLNLLRKHGRIFIDQ